MFDFIRKDFLWDAWDKKLDSTLAKHTNFHLKTIQDLAVIARLKDAHQQKIAEVGGGDSRVLRALARGNSCVNIEKFEGSDGGPKKVIEIEGVRNVFAFLGEFAPDLKDDTFDVVYSISVIEHVPHAHLNVFFDDGMRILKKGGLWLHAIDFYLEDEPSDAQKTRFEAYRKWMGDPRLKPLGPIFTGEPRFTCDMATNPDNVMYSWGQIAPALIPLRKVAQSVSILLGARKA